jgi:hypothetical protein
MKSVAMKAALGLVLAAIPLIVLAFSLWPSKPTYSERAEAPILKSVVIDGKLDEWPTGMQLYTFHNRPGAKLRVAYDPDRNVLLVALEVPDHYLVVGNDWHNTDACEVYTWGGGGSDPSKPMQYALIPGNGEYVAGYGNPFVSVGGKATRATGTRTQAAHNYDGKTITYEWAVEVYDRFPEEPAKLTANKEIGFDVVIVDKESNGHHNWIPWGSPGVHKFERPKNLGRLKLLADTVSSPR